MLVTAIKKGYFGLQIRNVGDVFNVPTEEQFSKRWMKKRSTGAVFPSPSAAPAPAAAAAPAPPAPPAPPPAPVSAHKVPESLFGDGRVIS